MSRTFSSKDAKALINRHKDLEKKLQAVLKQYSEYCFNTACSFFSKSLCRLISVLASFEEKVRDIDKYNS